MLLSRAHTLQLARVWLLLLLRMLLLLLV